MRVFLLSALLILLGFNGYSQILEDTTIVVTPHIKSGIIEFNSPEKIDSVEIRSVLDEIVFNQKIYNQRYVNADFVTRSCYYIVFTTFTGQKKIQKLFFSEEASVAPE